MRIAIWVVFGLLALLWTGGAFVSAQLTQWIAQALASGEAASVGRELAQWPVPQWLALWVDTAWLEALQSALLWTLETLQEALPLLGSALGWLVPLVWLLWGLGLVALMLLAGLAQLLLGRARKALPARA